MTQDESHDSPAPRKRRQRYAGTHPRRFDQRYKELDPERFPDMQSHIRAQGRTPAGTHVPVLVAEIMESLCPLPGDVVIDCTLGYGGHAAEFLRRIAPGGCLIGLDVDGPQLARTRERLAALLTADPPIKATLSTHRMNFAGIGKALRSEGLDGADVILADLGVSSMQIDNPSRGFSYADDGPLDMRMDDRIARTAADLVRSLAEDELAAALRTLGDEPDATAISHAIVARRYIDPIRTTSQLVAAVFEAKGLSRRTWRERAEEAGERLHPAALTFQALRMLVNDEPGSLAQLLRDAPYCLRPGGRIGIISFHSGEDRLVKHAFREGLASGLYSDISDGVIRADSAERRDNPRSSAAKLRWAKRGPAA